MSDDPKTPVVLTTVAGMFLILTMAFRADLWGRPEPILENSIVDEAFTNTATVRISAAELIRTGGDASGLDCYACHEKGKPPQVEFDENQKLKLPEEHNDLVMRHGRSFRNVHCFNCHDPENLDKLKTRDGRILSWEESTQLCASCHGPTYRDWEMGIHGRVSGYWDRSKGEAVRQECASCHHPHDPAFPSLSPAPGPRALRQTKHHSGRPEPGKETLDSTH